MERVNSHPSACRMLVTWGLLLGCGCGCGVYDFLVGLFLQMCREKIVIQGLDTIITIIGGGFTYFFMFIPQN